MHAAGGRGLKLVAADGAVDQTADFARINPGHFDRFPATVDALIARPRTAGPEPPLADAAHQLQAAFGQFQAAVERLQAPLDLVARDDLIGNLVAERLDANVA